MEQVKAPSLMNRMFSEHRADAVLVPVKASPAHLNTVVEGLKAIANLDGILVTVPHKFAVCDLVDRLEPNAARAQSANVLRREADGSWVAENFDGEGFVAGLLAAGHTVAGRTVALVGAGGAGVSLAFALLNAGAAKLYITDTADQRMDDLAARLGHMWPGRAQATATPAIVDATIAINATPLGLATSDPIPFDPSQAPRNSVIADIIMTPAETALLKAARDAGLTTHPGIHMLEQQLELYRRFFRIS
ncbi:shikimate dehydrogenase [Terrarubrum flagellatum]|uniref:shikimate dehydrogenase family protein n=1 Tax=Terrirubrum flagellatum TaxID=2895980 RepID=UPI00314527B8